MMKRNSMAKVIGLKLNWIYNSNPRKWKDLKGVTSIQCLLLFKPILSQSMVNGGLVRPWFLWEKLVRTKFFGLVNFHLLKIVSTSCLSKLKHIRVKGISDLRKCMVYFALKPCKKLGEFKKYVAQISSNFDPITPLSGQLWTFYILPTLWTDHLLIYFCPRSYWISPIGKFEFWFSHQFFIAVIILKHVIWNKQTINKLEVNWDILYFWQRKYLQCTGGPRLVLFFGPQQTALLEKPH